MRRLERNVPVISQLQVWIVHTIDFPQHLHKVRLSAKQMHRYDQEKCKRAWTDDLPKVGSPPSTRTIPLTAAAAS